MVEIQNHTEIESKIIEIEKAFEKFENRYSKWCSKDADTDYDLFEEVNDSWGECISLVMMEFEDESEIDRRIEIYEFFHQNWNQMTQTEYEEDIESIRNKNIERNEHVEIEPSVSCSTVEPSVNKEKLIRQLFRQKLNNANQIT